MKEDNIKENESISKGLEDFLNQELYQPTTPDINLDMVPEKQNTQAPDLDIPIINYSENSFEEETFEKPEVPISKKSVVNDETDDLANLRLFPAKKPKNKVSKSEPVSTKKRKQKAKPKKKLYQKKQKRNKKNPKENQKKHGFLKFLIVLILILLIVWYVIVGILYHKMQYDDSAKELKGPVTSGGVTNILLIGNDARSLDEMGRSDAMILLTISNKTHSVQMTSLLRDMYVTIPNHDGNRLNAAYSYGGPELLCQTIKQNLDIEVDHYVIVNFHAFAALVDAVGGIDLEVSNEEVQWINAYLNEYNLLEGKEMTSDYLDTSLSGMIHLNGPQALAYSRNRYIGTDFGRTERQRKVLSQIMKKLPLASITNTSEVVNGLFPNLKTNLTQFECYLLSFKAGALSFYESQQNSIPAEGTYSNENIRGMAVLSVDYDANKKIWKEATYGK